jgi:hypothetical protein
VNSARAWIFSAEARRRFFPLLASFLVTFAWFWLLARLFPLRAGRDMMTYFLWFRDLFAIEPEFPLLMLFRTPLTPLFYGTCFQIFGESGIEAILSLAYAASLTAVFAVLREFSLLAAWALNALVGINLWLFWSFNAVGSETLQMILLCFWFSCTFFAMGSSRVGAWVVSAVLASLLVLNRPGNQTFLLCFLLPFVAGNMAIGRRFVNAGVFLTVYAASYLAMCSLNYVRYGEFCFAKLGDAHLPFYRLFVQEHVISPENGPGSRQLADFVEAKILSTPVYMEHEITTDIFFRCSTQRMFNSLVYAVQKETGRYDFDLLRKAGMESIWRDPRGSLLRYLEHLETVFDYRDKKTFKISDLRDISRSFVRQREEIYARYAAKGLALPSEGDLLPSMPLFVANETRTQESWFPWPGEVQPWKVAATAAYSAPGGALFNISRKLIPNYCWFLFGALSLLLARLAGPVDMRIPLLTGIALLGLLATLFGSVQWEFRYPFDPIFTAFALHAAYALLAWLRKFVPARAPWREWPSAGS